MPIIHELSDHLADLIAAGEVVERPASVAKELVENAIDAHATQITVEIENGGISYLRIADNGCGMSPEDAPIAFRRHATSKLRTEDDLSAIGTLGFRGEALAAIASVSRIDLFTKQADTLAGVHLHLEAGEILENEEAGCPNGTTIIVRDIFYNTPARMKFLRKDFTEAGYVVGVVQHAALSHPEIAFTMIRDGRQVFATPGNGKLIAPVFSVFGKEMTANLIEVPAFSRGSLSAWGYITKAHAGRPNRSMQHFFVNGRYVKSRVMQAAMEEAYRNKLITGKYPSGVMFLTLPLHMVDVNVHPAKTEVKFAEEKAVFDVVYVACKNALEQDDNVPEIKAHAEKKPTREDHLTQEQQRMTMPQSTAAKSVEEKTVSAPVTPPVQVQEQPKAEIKAEPVVPDAAPMPERAAPAPAQKTEPQPKPSKPEKYPVTDSYSLMGRTVKVHSLYASKAAELGTGKFPLHQNRIKQPYVNADDEDGLDWDYLPQLVIPGDDRDRSPAAETASVQPEPQPETEAQPVIPEHSARVLGEAFQTYIVAEDDKGLLLIDKHAAHERMIFNRLRASVDIPRQELLTPVIAEVTAPEYAALSEQLERIREIGFDIEPFGQNSFAIRAIPAYLDSGAVQETVTEMADKLMNNRTPVPDRLDDVIHTVSCKAAIKAGMTTSLAELQDFCNRVLEDSDVVCCPHGRPVTVRLTKYELDKMFKRVNQ